MLGVWSVCLLTTGAEDVRRLPLQLQLMYFSQLELIGSLASIRADHFGAHLEQATKEQGGSVAVSSGLPAILANCFWDGHEARGCFELLHPRKVLGKEK